ncbi:hypothetical protein DZS_08240 [Dickeya ananatis]
MNNAANNALNANVAVRKKKRQAQNDVKELNTVAVEAEDTVAAEQEKPVQVMPRRQRRQLTQKVRVEDGSAAGESTVENTVENVDALPLTVSYVQESPVEKSAGISDLRRRHYRHGKRGNNRKQPRKWLAAPFSPLTSPPARQWSASSSLPR